MDKIETDFFKIQRSTSLVWYRYADDVFIIWIHGLQKLKSSLEDLTVIILILSALMNQVKNPSPFWTYWLVFQVIDSLLTCI